VSLNKHWNVTLSYTCDECQVLNVVKARKRSDLRRLPQAWLELRTQWDVGVQTNYYCSYSCLADAVAKRKGMPGYQWTKQ
jgi:hypothetical protein